MDDTNSSSLLMSEGFLFLFESTEVTAFETASAIFSTGRLELVPSPSIVSELFNMRQSSKDKPRILYCYASASASKPKLYSTGQVLHARCVL